jgi:RNA polymerase sigma factor (sigma-70 family)
MAWRPWTARRPVKDPGLIFKTPAPPTSPAVDPDAELVARVAKGDPAAVQALVARKLPRMLVEAEDVAQEVFVRAWRQAEKWTPGAGKFDTWMHRVALNLCYDRLRRRREDLMAEPPEQADPTPNAETGLVRADTAARVAEALQGLPQRQREAIVLCHYQELSNIEAAELMNISVEAVESLLARGRRALRAVLTDLRRERT